MGDRCERCGDESYTGLRFCGDCLKALAPGPPDGAAAWYSTPNACVALYPDGSTRRFDGASWGPPHPTWPDEPKRIREMLRDISTRFPVALTDVGRQVLDGGQQALGL